MFMPINHEGNVNRSISCALGGAFLAGLTGAASARNMAVKIVRPLPAALRLVGGVAIRYAGRAEF
jgi:hypothetical protein